jgi:hypothetical protein
MALYVEQSHIKSLLKNRAIVAQPTNNATTLSTSKSQLARKPSDQEKCDETKTGNHGTEPFVR